MKIGKDPKHCPHSSKEELRKCMRNFTQYSKSSGWDLNTGFQTSISVIFFDSGGDST
jgi:hypothetical protein